jgi:hypothetical protein
MSMSKKKALLSCKTLPQASKTLNTNNICRLYSGNTKGGSITEPLTSCLTGLE